MGFSVINKFPNLYFDAAFDYRWIRASKIIRPGQQSVDQDKLSIGIIAAEQLTEEEFSAKLEAMAIEQVLKEASEIINPKTEGK